MEPTDTDQMMMDRLIMDSREFYLKNSLESLLAVTGLMERVCRDARDFDGLTKKYAASLPSWATRSAPCSTCYRAGRQPNGFVKLRV